jgi:carboxylesterase
MAVDPSPFILAGGDVGVLLVHGFTGSPAELRPLGRYLNERGLTVAAPLLPGHGTTPEDANRWHWKDWLGCAESALADLQSKCRRVFVGGLSLGSLLALMLAARHHNLAGVIAYSPAIQVTDPRSYAVAIIKRLTPTVAKPPDFFADPAAQTLMWAYPVYPTAAAHEVIELIGEVKRAG